MGFNKEDENKTMTTKQQLESQAKVTVVSTASGNDMNVGAEPSGEVNIDDKFIEVGEPEIQQQAKPGQNLDEFVTFAPAPPHINQMTGSQLDNFMRESVVARPVRLPARLNARSKDPNFRLHWIECKAEDGRRVSDAEAIGFRMAKPEEVVGLDRSVKPQSDGIIRADDLVLMIIPCDILDGYYKHNALRSLQAISKKGVHDKAKAKGEQELRQGIAATRIPRSQFTDALGNPKLQIY